MLVDTFIGTLIRKKLLGFKAQIKKASWDGKIAMDFWLESVWKHLRVFEILYC